MAYEYKIDRYNDGFFETVASSEKKLMDRLKELEVLGWEVISIDGWYSWRIVSRRLHSGARSTEEQAK